MSEAFEGPTLTVSSRVGSGYSEYLEIVRCPSGRVPTDDEILIAAEATDEQLRYVIRELVKLSARQRERIASMEERGSTLEDDEPLEFTNEPVNKATVDVLNSILRTPIPESRVLRADDNDATECLE